MLSNPSATAEWVLADEKVDGMRMLLEDTAGTIADIGTNQEVKIERPENGYPFWAAKIEMVVGGELCAVEIEGASIDDVMGRSIAWMNRSAVK
jgi:hypothetical protein